jgi:biopolymer transport protein TolQ
MIWNAGLVVQLVLFLLVLFSVLSWAIIFSKYKVIRGARRENAEFEEIFWQAGSLSAAYNQTKHLVSSPLAAIFRLGYGEIGKVMRAQSGGDTPDPALNQGVIENLQRALNRGQAAESTSLGRAVTFLATTANTAPAKASRRRAAAGRTQAGGGASGRRLVY